MRLDATMSNSRPPEPPDPPDETGDPEALDRQRVLGAHLRILFDDIVGEGVPDEFTDLLDRLGSAEPTDGR